MSETPDTSSSGDQPDRGPVPSARELQEDLEAARRAGHAIPYETLAALAAAVGDLRRKVRFVESVTDRSGLVFAKDTRALVTRLTATVDTLGAKVDQLDETVAALQNGGDRVAAPNWVALSEAERGAELAKLADWVDRVLIPCYQPDPALLPCWSAHWPVIWELSTIWAEWRRIYDRPSPELAGALNFNQRWLPSALEHSRRGLAKCTDRHCHLTIQLYK